MFHLDHLPNPIPGEKLIYCLRRHPITLASLVICMVILLLAPFGIFQYLQIYQPDLLADQAMMTVVLLGGSIFFLYAWLFLFQNFVDWAMDLWIVTNKRILNIEQQGLFGRTASELRIYRIQDVTSSVNGFFHTMFDFGDVEIQTAGERLRFLFEQVPHPNKVAKMIVELAEIDRQAHLDEAVEEIATGEAA
ncbi:hypothetical protein EXS71_00785 [Candidatus Uhrbacteria bacterium]|nr:hypothetical protein [Candidatus Uhrbacteria bacterium]